MKFWWVVACCLLASQQAWAASTELLPYEKFCFNESLDGYTRNTEFTFRFHLEKSRGLEQLGVTVKAPSASEGEYLYETTASAGDFAARLKDDGPHTFCFENVNSRKHVVFWSVARILLSTPVLVLFLETRILFFVVGDVIKSKAHGLSFFCVAGATTRTCAHGVWRTILVR